ncbi:TPA: hypothetical protein QDB07_000846 [Burkholderia vietnamiensis]|uniref:hypothetical protein n=1 Tax=Burkholderia glumae TaxID=337 RepID=UPI00214FC3AB|nr:hypothetical protein [Burkholderia glumae]HDR9033397.1 hypothetical protein [Burkholderia vietnamiensis]
MALTIDNLFIYLIMIVFGGLALIHLLIHLIYGPRPPTEKMVILARRVAFERGVELPSDVLRSFHKTRRFLNRYSRDWLPQR